MTWNVAGVMTREVVTVGPDAPYKSCIRLLRTHGVAALPVLAGGRVVGIVTVTDLMLKEFQPAPRERHERAAAADRELTAGSVMSRRVITVPADAPLALAVRLMFEHHVNQLPVVDAQQRLVGIISRSDVLRVFLRSDMSIRKEVAEGVLADMSLVGRGRVVPQVRDGVVTLEGEVEPGTLTDVLVRLVASVPGVVVVHNHLKALTRARAHSA